MSSRDSIQVVHAQISLALVGETWYPSSSQEKGGGMLYLQADNGVKIIVLETENLEELKKGRPTRIPDGSVILCWTPDPEWLMEQIKNGGSGAQEVANAIEESTKRPQKPLRPRHNPRATKLR